MRAARGEATAQPGRRPLAAIRDPAVVVLLLIAFFSAISGKPLDGLLMLLVAAGLAGDVWARSRHAQPVPSDDEPAAEPPAAPEPAGRRRARRLAVSAGLAGGACYAVLVGSFSRFSWPATIAVAGLGALVVVVGWPEPVRPRPEHARLPLAGAAAWGAVLFAGGLWELWSLFQQPAMDTTSYAHPTISALTDPVLSAQPGRALVLGGWLLLGWYLVRR